MRTNEYLEYLDKILIYAIKETDDNGYVLPMGEKDEKDQGWLVLAGVIRGVEVGWQIGSYDLKKFVASWTRAVSDVDDKRSAWTTFALLYSLFLSGGKEGAYYSALPEETQRIFDRFVMQIDMSFLRAASRNYYVAAGFINKLRIDLGYMKPEECKVQPDDDIQVMLDCYLGEGFFNDDDSRGSNLDRRIDGYSAEIIGLLLHYDEVCGWQSVHHQKIIDILKDYVDASVYFVDADGEYAKWGRSLRGGSDVKKAFVWEVAAKEGVVGPELGNAVCRKMFQFFIDNGIAEDGLVFKDKAENKGIWDEYTTAIQALGYAAYGLAMGLKFGQSSTEDNFQLPAEKGNYLKYYQNSGFIVSNSVEAGIHYVVPVYNRLTKMMFLWHNRITCENDVSVDMSAKFMPLPYFGKRIPLPYVTQKYPFLPFLKIQGEEFYPKHVAPHAPDREVNDDFIRVNYCFGYCADLSFDVKNDLWLKGWIDYRIDRIDFCFDLPELAEAHQFIMPFYSMAAYQIDAQKCEFNFKQMPADQSIYGPVDTVEAKLFSPEQTINYSIIWK